LGFLDLLQAHGNGLVVTVKDFPNLEHHATTVTSQLIARPVVNKANPFEKKLTRLLSFQKSTQGRSMSLAAAKCLVHEIFLLDFLCPLSLLPHQSIAALQINWVVHLLLNSVVCGSGHGQHNKKKQKCSSCHDVRSDDQLLQQCERCAKTNSMSCILIG